MGHPPKVTALWMPVWHRKPLVRAQNSVPSLRPPHPGPQTCRKTPRANTAGGAISSSLRTEEELSPLPWLATPQLEMLRPLPWRPQGSG